MIYTKSQRLCRSQTDSNLSDMALVQIGGQGMSVSFYMITVNSENDNDND